MSNQTVNTYAGPIAAPARPPTASRPRRSRRGVTLGKVVSVAILAIGAVVMVAPFLWMFTTSLRSPGTAYDLPPQWIPTEFQWSNFAAAVNGPVPILRNMFNSAFIATVSSAISLIIGTSAGYALSRLQFRGAGLIMVLILVTQMMPPTAIVVPIYDLFRQLGMLNTIHGVTLGHISLVIPLAVWMTKGYFDSIPLDLENAARIDGCTRLSAFWHIALPLASPGLIVVFIYGFVTSWHEFLFARTLVSQQELWTGAVGLGSFRGEFFTLFEPQMAASVVFSMPVVLVFLFLQRRLISGGLAGGVR